jgi:hypothetical protein
MGGAAMDYFFNPETLRQQWATIANAPFFTVPPIVLGGLIVWWFRGTTLKGTIGGLKEQIAALDQRLKLAIEQSTAFATALDEIKKEFHTYKQRVFVEGRNASPAKVDDAIVTAADHNRMMKELSLGPLSAVLI